MSKDKAEAAKGGPRGYFDQSRDLLNSLVLVLPLLLIYQAGLFLTSGESLNGADFITIVIMRRWGSNGLLVFNGVLIVAGIIGVVVLQRRRRFDPRIAAPIAAESTIYALLLGVVITQILSRIGVHPPAMAVDAWTALASGGAGEAGVLARVCMALGAGVNEELVFRLGMVTAIAALAGYAVSKRHAMIVAVLVSSVLFSLAHYLGPEPFAMYTFLYRFLAGAIFCVLFALRGFAVAVYTHAIYDVLVMVVFRH